MTDLTGAAERRATLILGLLISAILLLPVAPSGAQVNRNGDTTAVPAAAPTATPTPEPTQDPALDDLIDDLEGRIDGEGEPSEAPAGDPADEPGAGDPQPVEAEGGDAEEVIAAPTAPQPADRGDGAAHPRVPQSRALVPRARPLPKTVQSKGASRPRRSRPTASTLCRPWAPPPAR